MGDTEASLGNSQICFLHHQLWWGNS